MAKRILAAVIVLGLLLVAGLVIGPYLFGAPAPIEAVDAGILEPDSAPPVDVGGPPEPQQAVLRDVHGRVLRVSETGELVEAREGEAVPLDTTLETEEGSAVLSFGDDSSIELESQSSVTVSDSTDGLTSIRLERGRTVARADGDAGERVRVTFAGSDAVAEATDGEIAAVSDGAGRVTVASQRGNVSLSARGETVEIREGQQSAVLPERAPTAPRAVPTSFFLRVRRPPGQSRVAATTVRGEATPGAVVSVNGTPTNVDENGRFQARVALRQGRNDVTVQGRDASGRSQSRSHTVVVDSSASGISSDVSWD